MIAELLLVVITLPGNYTQWPGREPVHVRLGSKASSESVHSEQLSCSCSTDESTVSTREQKSEVLNKLTF